jgi:hypothetical protein
VLAVLAVPLAHLGWRCSVLIGVFKGIEVLSGKYKYGPFCGHDCRWHFPVKYWYQHSILFGIRLCKILITIFIAECMC